jgi:hypothetical protein
VSAGTHERPGQTKNSGVQLCGLFAAAEDHDAGVGGIGVSQKNVSAARSLVGVDKMHRVLFIRTSEASLYSLGEILSDKGSSGLNLDYVLNLDGDADSGLLVRTNGTHSPYGNVDATIPNALIAVGNKSTK